MISLIAAVAENGVIGNRNDLPWNLRDDLRRFARLTKGHTVVMGRKNFESILARLGHPLPERRNVVISKNLDYHAEGAEVVNSWAEAKSLTADDDKVFVIGGAQIYRMALSDVDELLITKVHASPDGDIYFPDYDKRTWKAFGQPEFYQKSADNQYDFECKVYRRK